MAAPTLQAEGTIAAVTTGSVTPTLPSHATDDILVVHAMIWVPNTASKPITTMPTPATWNKEVGFFDTGGAEISLFWKRATSGAESNPVLTRAAGWDTGTDTCYAARAYVVRGVVKSGTPWDEIDPTGAYTTTTGPFDAVTVSGAERTVIQFGGMTDDAAWGAAPGGWTAGTAATSGTGTDAGFQTFRKENVSSDTGTDETNVSAPVQGGYIFQGASFIPAAATPRSGFVNFQDPGVL